MEWYCGVDCQRIDQPAHKEVCMLRHTLTMFADDPLETGNEYAEVQRLKARGREQVIRPLENAIQKQHLIRQIRYCEAMIAKE